MKHHISKTNFLKKIPKLSEAEGLEVWKITNKLLPPECFWRTEKAIGYEAIALVAYSYLRKRKGSIIPEEICLKCIQVYNKPCPHCSCSLH